MGLPMYDAPSAVEELKQPRKLISKDDGLTKEVEKFIQQQNEEQFNVLMMRLRKDLYK